MAYISKEDVKAIREGLKKVFPKPFKLSVTCHNHDEVIVRLMEGNVKNLPVNESLNDFYPENYEGFVRTFIEKVNETIGNVKANYNRNANDFGADYADYNYFKTISIGKWDKPFKYVEA